MISPVEVSADRAASYRMFSRIFFKPLDEAEIHRFAAMDYIALAQQLEGTGLLAEGFNDMGRALKRHHTGTRQQLATDYTMCFDGVESLEGEVAVPYASVFISEKALLNQEPRHQVYRVYRDEGIKLDSKIRLPEDHLSFELEFIALLADRAGLALKDDNPSEAIRNLELSREFIDQHIFSWFDLFAKRAEKILKTRFYRGALKATRGYLELDLDTIADLIEIISGEGLDEGK
ncbi:MAG: molecular chaperone TorD family protein [Coriobacteriales bacterium]|jgi:TorA maturation chaperone TorD|nr:molecular chaperone TorD family protein [Coriobacteriales bacterium]